MTSFTRTFKPILRKAAAQLWPDLTLSDSTMMLTLAKRAYDDVLRGKRKKP